MNQQQTQQLTIIREYLENAYTGARMADDAEMMDRIARAIAALEAPADMDIFNDDFSNYSFKKAMEVRKDGKEGF